MDFDLGFTGIRSPGEEMENMPEESFGARVKRLRMATGLSLGELAAITELGRTSLHDIENGKSIKPSAESVYALSLAFGVGMEELWIGSPVVSEARGNEMERIADLGNRLRRIAGIATVRGGQNG